MGGKTGASAGNVSAEWIEDEAWREWGKPYKLTVGTSRRADAFERLVGPRRPGGYRQPVRVTLERDTDNEHDRNAIMVVVEPEHVGFLPKAVAARLAPVMDKLDLMVFDVPGVIVGGCTTSQKQEFGCWIWPRRCFKGGIKIADHCNLGEDFKPYGSAWSDYLAWPDSDSPPGASAVSLAHSTAGAKQPGSSNGDAPYFDVTNPNHILPAACVGVLVLMMCLMIWASLHPYVPDPKPTPTARQTSTRR